MIRVHRSLFLLSTLFLIQYTIINYMMTPIHKSHPDFDYFELIKSFQMIILSIFMLLIEFRSAKFIKYFRFTESPYIKSIFVLFMCGMLYRKKDNDQKSQLRIVLGCIGVLGLVMLGLSPFVKRKKGISY